MEYQRLHLRQCVGDLLQCVVHLLRALRVRQLLRSRQTLLVHVLPQLLQLRVKLSKHTVLLLSAVLQPLLQWRLALVPLTLVLRSPALSMFALRGLTVVFGAARFLPVRYQWYVLSRLWVGAILHLERIGTAIAASSSKPGDGDAKKKK